jgi:hypothetical protein
MARQEIAHIDDARPRQPEDGHPAAFERAHYIRRCWLEALKGEPRACRFQTSSAPDGDRPGRRDTSRSCC